MGAIHSHNSSLHSGPPNPNGTKRTRKDRGKAIDLATSDDDALFTLKTAGKNSKKHEITVKHEHVKSSPSPTSTPSSFTTDNERIGN